MAALDPSTAAELAHSLKTPLTVLQNTLRLLGDGTSLTLEQATPIMLAQIERISQQVGYYLHTAERSTLLPSSQIHSVSVMLDLLCHAISKIYYSKGVFLTVDISAELLFIGDRNDFIEIMGNLLDNAYKYCHAKVMLTALALKNQLHVHIDDDGPGIAPHQCQQVFQRGYRIDHLIPGQGLGLAITSSLIRRYTGQVQIGQSKLGGAQIIAIFNAQQ